MNQILPRFEHDQFDQALPAAGLGAIATSLGNLSLKQVDIRSHVFGLACRTVITQVFHNSHDEFVEAIYIFPLPGRFAVTDCQMRVHDRVVQAELKERSQARATYDQAIRAGHGASIAEEERSETFSLRIGNIGPGQTATVELTLVGLVTVVEGEATLRIPLVVAPRYVSGSPLCGRSVGLGVAVDTDETPDASRVTPPVLLPGFPNPVALSVEVEFQPGTMIDQQRLREGLQSSLHSVVVSQHDPCQVRLLPGERINRDFILRFPILQNQTRCVLEYSHSPAEKAGTFALTILPPVLDAHSRCPRDVVFVLDRSGSMGGWKMAAARRAVARMIDTLGDADRFAVLAFDNVVETPDGAKPTPRKATDRNRWQASQWVAGLQSRGGTELGGALRVAFRALAEYPESEAAFSHDRIVVVITDGQVAGEDSVLRTIAEIHQRELPRIFTMGIDRAVNAGFLRRLADIGGGVFELVESEERLDQVMDRFHRDLRTPVLTDLQVEPVNFDLVGGSLTPAGIRHLFAERPMTLYGRVVGKGESIGLRMTARDADGNGWREEITARRRDNASLLPLWGRGRVRDLEDQYARGDCANDALQRLIIKTSLDTSVLSRFTAYVAVDYAETVNEGGMQHQVVQPVEQPEGWQRSPMLRRITSPLPSEPNTHRVPRQSPFAPSSEQQSAAEMVPESVARENNVLPVRAESGKLHVRMGDPYDFETLDKLRFILNREIVVESAGPGDIHQGLNELYGDVEGDTADSMLQEFTDTSIDFCELVDEASDFDEIVDERCAPIVRLSHLMIADAVQLKASHVYLQPFHSHMGMIYLIDGEVHERDCPPRRLLNALISRLRMLAKTGPKTAQLQSGEIRISIANASYLLRAYFIPTAHGPSVMIRFTNRSQTVKTNRATKLIKSWLDDAREHCGRDLEAESTYQQLLADC